MYNVLCQSEKSSRVLGNIYKEIMKKKEEIRENHTCNVEGNQMGVVLQDVIEQ